MLRMFIWKAKPNGFWELLGCINNMSFRLYGENKPCKSSERIRTSASQTEERRTSYVRNCQRAELFQKFELQS